MEIRTLSLVREKQGDQGTFGHVMVDDMVLFTGELPWRDLDGNGQSDSSVSRIPPGKYRCQFTKSGLFPAGTFELVNVESGHRVGIRIHKGNWCGDKSKGWYSDVLGCILLGTVQESRPCPKNGGKVQDGVFNSTVAYEQFMAAMGLQPFDLEIVEEFRV